MLTVHQIIVDHGINTGTTDVKHWLCMFKKDVISNRHGI